VGRNSTGGGGGGLNSRTLGQSGTAAARAALADWSGTDYRALQRMARTGTVDPTGENTAADLEKRLAAIDKVVASGRIPKATTLYRGLRLKGADLTVGRTFSDDGFSSTTTSARIGRDFARSRVGDPSSGVFMSIRVPRGASGASVRKQGEREVVLPRGSTFRVRSVKVNADGSRDVVVDLVTSGKPRKRRR
jgi:hypothetical protein